MFVRWDLVGDKVDGSMLDVVNVESGAATTIAETHGAEYFAYPRWSPDGHSVVTQLDTWSDTGAESVLVANQVAVVDLRPSLPAITKLTEPSQGAQYPDWHPSEDLIVFQAAPLVPVLGQSDLFTMRSDGSEMNVLVDDAQSYGQPTWLPDGSGVMFIRQTTTGIESARMYTIVADGTGLRPATSNGPQFGTHPRLRPTP